MDNKSLNDIIHSEYLAMLFIEFSKAQGIDLEKENLSTKEKEFNGWIKAMQQVKNLYADFVFDKISDSILTAELGKGRLNSIVPDLNKKGIETIAITPYIETFDPTIVQGNNGKISYNSYTQNIEIKYENPEIQAFAPNITPDYFYQIDTLITHLPMRSKSISTLIETSRIYNDIAIGAYGFTEDKDIDSKIRRLQEIKEKINSFYCVGCDEEYIRENGMYLYLLKSNQKTRILVKSR